MSLRLIDNFEKQAKRCKDNTAILHGNNVITYQSLNRLADAIANELALLECHNSPIVGIALEHGTERIATFLGALKANIGYFVPDISLHDNQLSEIFKHSGCSIVVCSSLDQFRIEPLLNTGCHLLLVESCTESNCLTNFESTPPSERIDYIRYTSGSTGAPKGVIHDQRTSLHLAQTFVESVDLKPDDRVTLFNTFWHTLIHGTLIKGATLCLFDLKRCDYRELANWLNTNQITILSTFPTAFRKFCVSLNANDQLQSIRTISLSGEIMIGTDIRLVEKNFSADCTLINSYGCSEFAHISSCSIDRKTNVETLPVPAGHPSTSIQLSIINGDNESANCVGEIIVDSPYLTDGYFGMGKLTDSVYIKDSEGEIVGVRTGDYGYIDEHNCLYVLGRSDRKVKVKGFLVSLDEIETTLKQHPCINSAVVCPFSTVENDHRLAAFITTTGQQISQSELRIYLACRLPSYMLPNIYIEYAELPLLPSGKVDTIKLSQLSVDDLYANQIRLGYAHRENYLAPRNDLELRMSLIWERLLNIRPIGILDDFFELGGDSLSATQVISRIHDAFQVSLPLSSVFTSPVLADMANLIAREVNS